MQSLTIRVNGRERTVAVPADMPLLWVLRDTLELTGTKYGCGIGVCGACTVHVDGRAVPSCTLPVGGVGEAAVVTIEGLGADGRHPVQQAWIDEDVPQCGYCQAGQLMAAAALVARTPAPTAAEIDAGMRANVCRCGTYERIRRAVRRAAAASGD